MNKVPNFSKKKASDLFKLVIGTDKRMDQDQRSVSKAYGISQGVMYYSAWLTRIKGEWFIRVHVQSYALVVHALIYKFETLEPAFDQMAAEEDDERQSTRQEMREHYEHVIINQLQKEGRLKW